MQSWCNYCIMFAYFTMGSLHILQWGLFNKTSHISVLYYTLLRCFWMSDKQCPNKRSKLILDLWKEIYENYIAIFSHSRPVPLNGWIWWATNPIQTWPRPWAQQLTLPWNVASAVISRPKRWWQPPAIFPIEKRSHSGLNIGNQKLNLNYVL